MSHDFLIPVLSDLALFFRSNNLWASILLLTSENALVFMYRWMRSSRIFFVISLSVWFILLFHFEKFASTPVSSSTALVMSWPSISLEGVSVCFKHLLSYTEDLKNVSRNFLFLVFTSLCSGNSCFSSPNLTAAKIFKYSCSISELFWLFFLVNTGLQENVEKTYPAKYSQLIFLCRWDLQKYI